MIDKPKRPKQPNIQDRQPPRTLEELINRYDLDNTKIYDFLDELVELLNTERKSIDTSINDLNNNKVNKSGDTMTGDLNMQSNSVKFGNDGNIQWKEDGFGDKFRIIPDFFGAGTNNKLKVQSTVGDAGEDPTNWKDLVTIHADSGEIDLIHPTTWTNATLSSYINGTVRYTKIGNIVIVNFSDVQVKSNLSHNVILASGLPTSTVYQMTTLTNFDAPGSMRIAVNPSGQIVDHYSSNTVSNDNYYGTLIYVTNQ